MTPAAAEFDVEAVGVRGVEPDAIEHSAIGEGTICVQSKAEIGLRKSREQAVFLRPAGR
jgi:hypothetical protein